MSNLPQDAIELTSELSRHLKTVVLEHEIKQRPDGPFLVYRVGKPSEAIFKALRDAQSRISPENIFRDRVNIIARTGNVPNRIELPETRLLRITISENLTVNQHTFSDSFFSRYIRSVFGFEEQIIAEGNYVVFGRRGSGKSSLLAYAMNKRKEESLPYAWVSMQPFTRRKDIHVSIDVISDILQQLSTHGNLSQYIAQLDQLTSLKDLEASKLLERMLPRISKALSTIADENKNIAIFIDDLHVVDKSYQPRFLGHVYAISRAIKCHLKISGIEQFSRLWSPKEQIGIESPHDAQILKLDYNLTMPERSKSHIVSILDAHSVFCGLPSVNYVSGADVLSRLVWVAAAVPRDALYIFAQSIIQAELKGQKRISVTGINSAASEATEQKLKDLYEDSVEESDASNTRAMLEKFRAFCTRTAKSNVVLVEIKSNDPGFMRLQELVALRLVHVINEGITPHEAGRRYQALMLDYGFYVGVRAARSVQLFQKNLSAPAAKDLRNLQIFDPAS